MFRDALGEGDLEPGDTLGDGDLGDPGSLSEYDELAGLGGGEAPEHTNTC